MRSRGVLPPPEPETEPDEAERIARALIPVSDRDDVEFFNRAARLRLVVAMKAAETGFKAVSGP